MNVLTYETSRWRQKITSSHSLLAEVSPEIDPKWILGAQDWQIRLLGFDHQKLNPTSKSFSVLRILTCTANKAVILTLALDSNKRLKKLIARSEIRKHNIESYIQSDVLAEEKNAHVIIVEKYVALYEQATLQFKDQNGNPRSVHNNIRCNAMMMLNSIRFRLDSKNPTYFFNRDIVDLIRIIFQKCVLSRFASAKCPKSDHRFNQ